MLNEHMKIEQSSLVTSDESHNATFLSFRAKSQEMVLAALVLVIGPETDDAIRTRATRRLARQGPALLPLLLKTLNNYPEITLPSWPWWPPQYEHCSHLLVHLCQEAGLQLEAVLQPPLVSQPVGPVLWTSVIEAAGLQLDARHEALLCQGLAAPWSTTRYAAAMALARLVGKVTLLNSTLEALRARQCADEAVSIRLAASYALLRSGDSNGVEVLMQLLDPDSPEEARKAAAFILATEPPLSFCLYQRKRLIQLLLTALHDQNGEISLHAASALSSIASPATLPTLFAMLDASHPQVQIAVMTTLEEMASRQALRREMQQHRLPVHVLPLLRSDIPEVRRQASYTLAACGGEYATAVLGITILNRDHPAHIEAIEGLRVLHGALGAHMRLHVVRWLLDALRQSGEEVQATALDSLASLAGRARAHGQKKALAEISQEIFFDGTPFHLLTCASAWVRQRAIELLSTLENQPPTFHAQLIHLLYSDNDSGVCACVAYMLGHMKARWAIPDLIQTLLDPNEYVAETALNALGQLASPDDAIVTYIIKELAASTASKDREAHHLAQSAQMLLKKWRKADKKKTRDIADEL